MKVLNEKRQFQNFHYNIVNLIANENPNKILFVLPGAAYNFLGPLMYYPTHDVLETGGAVITADYDFRFVPEEASLLKEEVLKACVYECMLFAKKHYPQVSQKFFLAKSIGTQALCYLDEVALKAEFSLLDSRWIWLTPVFLFPNCLDMMARTTHSSLFVIGDKDPHYSQAAIQKIKENSLVSVRVFEGADHSMDINNHLEKTMQCHQEVTREVINFWNI